VVRYCFEKLDAGFLSLAEVEREHVERIMEQVDAPLGMFFDDTGSTKLGGLFLTSKSEVLEVVVQSTFYMGTTHERALRLKVRLKSGESDCHIFLAHFPSRIVDLQQRDREAIATDLKRQIDSFKDFESAGGPIIVLGDFNDEPFDRCMTHWLHGTRDRQLVRSKPSNRLLYNPSWRWLGEPEYLNDEGEQPLGSGSCFFRGDRLARWRTFDQALVSRSLLGGFSWVLIEEQTGILRVPPLLTTAAPITKEFDHFPIILTIARNITETEVTSNG
jgi:hypothetical protein